MTKSFYRVGAAALLLALPLAACNEAGSTDEKTATTQTTGDMTRTLAAAMPEQTELSTLNQALRTTGLGSIFDGTASYTVLAPTNDAFDALGAQGAALMEKENHALLAAVLKDHIVPGQISLDAIDTAIAQKGGKVSMTTLGEGTVTFSKDKDGFVVTRGDGSSARLLNKAVNASNGTILQLDKVLMP